HIFSLLYILPILSWQLVGVVESLFRMRPNCAVRRATDLIQCDEARLNLHVHPLVLSRTFGISFLNSRTSAIIPPTRLHPTGWCNVAAACRAVTSNPEVISSPVGLVATNAPGVTNQSLEGSRLPGLIRTMPNSVTSE